MTIRRRTFIHAGAVALGMPAAAVHAQSGAGAALDWPTKPVKFVVPFAPGGGADVATRMLADQLRTVWGGRQSAIVDNKTGANTIIAVNSVLGAPSDGHTFLATINLTFQLPHLGQKLPFNPMTDLIPVGAITLEQLVLVVNPNLGVKSFGDFAEKAGKDPKAFSFGTFGVGSTAHLVAAEIAKQKKIDMVIAHYRGAAPAVQAVLSGEVAMALSNFGSVQQHIAAGRLVPIAVTGARRYRFAPDVPTLKELGLPIMESPSWIGVFAPRGTPAEVVQKLGADMRAALQAPELVQKINGFYQEPGLMSVEEFQALVKRDDTYAGGMIRAHQIRLEQ
ncbi:Bug family tripartite tricarboxylate transporter substrate binding protein [Xenophilus azovorans]|uniref:Bug family tripartite tricarboxylate transporter substrate binding protein n=1 Tax=Xenophilus azovorans TaxID=151755 RepID=UPI0006920C14|nr:tripartite tricarboxylate transporter substrate binding protein [Xenophilus azovorans]